MADRGGAQIHFEEVTASAGIDIRIETYGIAWGDFDRDGDADAYLSNHLAPSSLYLNQGDGTFVDIAPLVFDDYPGVGDTHGSGWADFDRDGDVDLMQQTGIETFKPLSVNSLWVQDDGVMTNQAVPLRVDYPEHRGRSVLWLDWTGDGFLDLVLAGFRPEVGVGEPEIFAQVERSDGTRFFEKRSTETGFSCTNKTLFALLSDLNRDGVLDLICANTPFPQKVYDMTTIPFRDITDQFPRTTWAQDVAIFDFSGDALPDMFVSRMERPFPGAPLPPALFINNGAGFDDRTVVSGLAIPAICRSAVAADFDNDMDVDLFRVCSTIDRDNLLYENRGDGLFALVPGAGGAAGSDEGMGESAAVADYDEDGFPDMFISNGACARPRQCGGDFILDPGPHQLYRNTSGDPGGPARGNHWLQIDLVGTLSNPHGIGAWLEIIAGGVTQLREQTGGVHIYSQNYPRIHVGLGTNSMVDRLVIHWPSGTVQELSDLPADHIYEVQENGPAPGSGAIGDLVWVDADGDGIQDPGEPGVVGVTVNLQDCDSAPLDSHISDAGGIYTFNNIAAGSYRVEVILPTGFRFSPQREGDLRGQDSNIDPDTGLSNCLALSAGQSRLGVDAGVVPDPVGSGRIGDFVWRDSNADGIHDSAEPGVAAVHVDLLDCNGNVLVDTTTDTGGGYLFEDLPVGSYVVRFVAPDDTGFSPQSQGTLRGLDSDADPVTGLTSCRTLGDGQSRFGVDAGLVPTI